MRRKSVVAFVSVFVLAAAERVFADEPAPPPAAPAAADVVTLKDGRRLEGEVIAEDDRFVSVKVGGVTRAYAKDSVASIERGQRPAAGAPAAEGARPAVPEKEKGKKKAKAPAAAELSDAARAWLDELLAKSADADATVRRSVAAAVAALGPAAAPAVRAAAEAAPEGPQKEFLSRLAEMTTSRKAARPFAPPPPGAPPEGADARPPGADAVRRIADELSLREDQRPKFEALLYETFARRLELFRSAKREGLTAETVEEKSATIRSELLSEMKRLLDAAQYAAFEEKTERLLAAPARPPAPR